MWNADIPAFVPFYVAALLALVTRGWLRAAIMLTAPVAGGVHLFLVEPGVFVQAQILDLILVPYRVDKLSLIFGYAFHIGGFLALLYALQVRDTLQHVAALIYAGSAVGIVFAGDLVTLFVFWELTGLSSAFLIWASRDRASVNAGIRYLLFQVFSGVLLMAGVLWHWETTGNLSFTSIGLDAPASWLIFLAFGIKAGFPLLHNWITDGYSAATPTGTVFLCIFTTKAAIYALARGFPGTELLIYIGMVMACFPIFYAVIENDMRRVLSYSMINQLGFMVVGIGIGTELSLNGTAAHAFSHIIYKALLFMSMGAVLYMTGRIRASELGGLYKTMPLTTTWCVIGAASISAFPLFSGFVSKALIMSALSKEGHHAIWLAMLFASAGVFHHAGIKIPYFAFFAHDSGIRVKDPPLNMLLAMGFAAALCIVIGVYPALLYQHLPFDYAYTAYDVTHVLTQTQLLFFSALAFVWLNMRGLYPPELPSTNLDAEWFYRRLLPATSGHVVTVLTVARDSLMSALQGIRAHGLYNAGRRQLQTALSRNWPTGSMVLWVGVFLAMMLIAGVLSNLGG